LKLRYLYWLKHKVVSEIKADGYNAIACMCHVGEDDHLKNLIETTINKYGKIDILVNNAGINPVFDRLENADEKLFNKILDINTKSPFKLSNLAFKYMKENKSGSIIDISSVEGHKPDKGLGVYSISKAAISMLTKSQAKEWGKYGVRSNAICPGLIKTKLSSALWQNEEILETWLGDLPIRRPGDPDEISGMAIYLASEASSYTTGETFNIDGGYMINLIYIMKKQYSTEIENLEDLNKYLGKEIGISEWFEMSQEKVNSFAELTQDKQWIHIDQEKAAKYSPYKKTIAHGFHVLSYASQVVFQTTPRYQFPFQGIYLNLLGFLFLLNTVFS
jgi:NAD(P)-dependent dehydrogenase (short-subunit alcohol dehydrogenase family)